MEKFPYDMAWTVHRQKSWSNNYPWSYGFRGFMDLALLLWSYGLSQWHQCLVEVSSFCEAREWRCTGLQLHGEWPFLHNGLLSCQWHLPFLVYNCEDRLKSGKKEAYWICEGTRGMLERTLREFSVFSNNGLLLFEAWLVFGTKNSQ